MSITEEVAQKRALSSAALKAARRILNGQVAVVVGLQWGDEGKGKVMDYLAEIYDAEFRFSGGGNAGHTVKDEDGNQKILHFFPASVLRGKPAYIGRDVFLDVEKAQAELDTLRSQGVTIGPIYIDRGASIRTSWHGPIEAFTEWCKGNNAVGTTGQAIVAYAVLNAMRMRIRADDCMRTKEELLTILKPIEKALCPWFEELNRAGKLTRWDSAGKVAEDIIGYRGFLQQYLADTSKLLHDAIQDDQRIALEGAQGSALQPLWGIEPFVSLGQSNAPGAANSCGIGLKQIDTVIGVFKPIPTKVGAGPFMSEIATREECTNLPKIWPNLFKDGLERTNFLEIARHKINIGSASSSEESAYYQVLGKELGATSGRGRSVGYLDLPWLRYAIRINDPDYLAITKIDMLDGISRIRVITDYMLDGEVVASGTLPDERRLDQIEQLYTYVAGWNESTYACKSWHDLPHNAQQFIRWLEAQLETSIIFVGTGPNRDHVTIRELVDANEEAFRDLP